ncbi:head-tail connector protein [Xenorhabdus ehlersii]|uniref:Phage protein n=1 Tax=Xenorhabdus ehlersii TaxID=290111 RepID=A0A2D0IKJ3_9GAMM|nr:head-tail connector protein [Xenorhabdus ehlersii]PHM22290.1 phage protein [Xenorhabdus ehlersii]RKE87862.1 putative phage protein (predicted DNA packaging) [Xenorhabdus ehlersii]
MIPLSMIKDHCRIDSPADDALLRQYENAAIHYVLNYTDRKTLHTPKEEITPAQATDNALVLDEAVTQAILLLIGHWYENRTAVVVGQSAAIIPFAVKALLQPYKRYSL